MSDSRGSGSSTPVKQQQAATPSSSYQATTVGSSTPASANVSVAQAHLLSHAIGLQSLSMSAQHMQALQQQHSGMMSQATQRGQQQSQSVHPQQPELNPQAQGNSQHDQHQNNQTHQHQQQNNPSPNPQTNVQPHQQSSVNPSQQQVPNVLSQQQQQNTVGPSVVGQNTNAVSIQQQHAALLAQQQQQQQQQNVTGVLHHAQQQPQNNLHVNSQQSVNTSNSIPVQQSAVMANNPNHQHSQQQQQQQQQQQTSGQSQGLGPSSHSQQHQNPAILNQGNMVRVSMPIQNLPTSMHGMQAIQSFTGMQGMQPISQIQQNVQQIQGMSQMQGLQHIPTIQHVQGVQQMQPLQGVPGLQGVQVLPMQNFQGSQLFAGQHYNIPPMFQNQLQAQMMSPAINLQNMQGAPKSPGIPIQQQPQVEVYNTTFQPLQIQQQQQNAQQQQGIINTQNSSSQSGEVGTPTKTSISISRPTVGGPHQQQPGVLNMQQGPQTQLQQPAQQPQLMGQMKQVVQQQQRPVVIGQIANMISNQGTGNQTMINQPKSPLIAPGNQMISNQQIRFSNQATIVNNNGQIVQPVMSMNQFQAAGNIQQNMSLAQPIFATQAGTILSSQPVYIRAAAPLQQQQGICVQVAPGIKPKEVKPVVGVSSLQQGARSIGPVQVGSGIRIRAPAPRTIRPQKTVSPRNIQPKPPSSSITGVSSLPTAMVSPKPGTSKPAQTLTKVVTCTTAPRVAQVESQPCNSIVNTINTIKKGASMVNKVLSNHSVADSSTPEPIIIEDKIRVLTPVEKENVKKEESVSSSSIDVMSSRTAYSSVITTTATTTAVTSVASPLSILEPKAPLGTDFVVSRTAERKQAIVKPVLTHVIEGFVIQEASEPFPVHRSNVMGNLIESKQQEVDMEVDKMTALKETQPSNNDAENVPCCELCKKQMPAYRMKASKRFCSNVCAKRYNVGCTKRVGLFRGNNMYDKYSNRKKHSSKEKDGWSRTEDGGRITTGPIKRADSQQTLTLSLSTGTSSQSDEDSNHHVAGGLETSSEAEETESQAASTTTDGGSSAVAQEDEEMASPARSPPELERVDQMDVTPPASGAVTGERMVSPKHRKPLQQWNVQEVSSFINSLPGCGMYAEMFSSQEIDGQALMLLKEDHLMTAMNIKLGPALKICASIKQILEDS